MTRVDKRRNTFIISCHFLRVSENKQWLFYKQIFDTLSGNKSLYIVCFNQISRLTNQICKLLVKMWMWHGVVVSVFICDSGWHRFNSCQSKDVQCPFFSFGLQDFFCWLTSLSLTIWKMVKLKGSVLMSKHFNSNRLLAWILRTYIHQLSHTLTPVNTEKIVFLIFEFLRE